MRSWEAAFVVASRGFDVAIAGRHVKPSAGMVHVILGNACERTVAQP